MILTVIRKQVEIKKIEINYDQQRIRKRVKRERL